MFSKEKVEEICGQHYYFKSDLSKSFSLVTGKKIGNAALSVAIKAVKAIKAKDSGKIWQQRALKRHITWSLQISFKCEVKSDT